MNTPAGARSHTVTFIGGMRWPPGPPGPFDWRSKQFTWGGNATFPLARLRLDVEGVHIIPRPIVTWIMGVYAPPTYDFAWETVARVECLRRGGLRFVTHTMDLPVIFWTFHLARVLGALEARGVPVDRRPRPVDGRL